MPKPSPELEAAAAAAFPLDHLVKAFISQAPNSTPEEVRVLLYPLTQTLSVHLIGPFWGTIVGLANVGRLDRAFARALVSNPNAIIDQPGYNDFLMAQWNISKDITLVYSMLERLAHTDPSVSESASWMIGSVADTNPEFQSALENAGYHARLKTNEDGSPELKDGRAQFSIVPLYRDTVDQLHREVYDFAIQDYAKEPN